MIAVPRLEVFAMSLNDKDIDYYDSDSDTENNNPINFKGPIRILIGDGKRVQEIYNSVKLDKFFTPLPGQVQDDSDGTSRDSMSGTSRDSMSGTSRDSMSGTSGDSMSGTSGDSISGHDTDLPGQNVEVVELEDSISGDDDADSSLTGKDNEEELHDLNSISLPLTGPGGDIVPYSIFDVIVHQGTGNPKTDESDLKEATHLYLMGRRSKRSDVVHTFQFRGLCYYNRITPFRVPGPFGSLTLDCVGFMDSRLVTVDPKWLLEGMGDGKINHSTESNICGELSFYTSEIDLRSVLLKTPDHKAVKVVHGQSIPLLRSKVAIPVCEFFTVEATLHDPNNNSVVRGSATFYFDDDFEDSVLASKNIVGSGAKIKVAVTMAPNDIPYLIHGSSPKDVTAELV